jgi:hypothetical protein
VAAVCCPTWKFPLLAFPGRGPAVCTLSGTAGTAASLAGQFMVQLVQESHLHCSGFVVVCSLASEQSVITLSASLRGLASVEAGVEPGLEPGASVSFRLLRRWVTFLRRLAVGD